MQKLARLASRFRVTPVTSEREARRRRRRRLIALAVAVASTVGLASQLPAWQLLDLRTYDFLSTLTPPPLPEGGPVIVAIDEPSFAEIGQQWPWPRSLHGRLVEALRGAGASAIGLDIIFAEPSAEQADEALAASLGPDVVLAGDYSVIESAQAEQVIRTEPLPLLAERGARTGIASIVLDRDGMMRRLPPYEDGFARVLAGEAALPEVPDGLIRVFGPARTYPTVSYYQALDPQDFLPEGFFAGRPVIVGFSLQNTPTLESGGTATDAYPTSHTVHTGRLTPGVEIQATVYDNLVHRLFVRPAPRWAELATIAFAAALGAFAVRRATGWPTVFYGAAGILVFAAASYGLIESARLFLPAAAPSGALAGVLGFQAVLDYVEERRTRMQVMRAFSQYLAPALVERLARDPSQLRLGGERRTITVLFSDVRGFTTIAEGMKDAPDQLTTLVNRILTPLSDIVLSAGGTIDKYIGDCIMAFWNAPLDDPDHAFHAVTAGIAMLEAIQRLDAELRAEGLISSESDIRIGVGINTGEVIVGNMGSERRFDYSALGDAVNYASRLEGISKNYASPLILGEATAAAIADRLPVVEIDRIAVRGRTAVAPIFSVVAPETR